MKWYIQWLAGTGGIIVPEGTWRVSVVERLADHHVIFQGLLPTRRVHSAENETSKCMTTKVRNNRGHKQLRWVAIKSTQWDRDKIPTITQKTFLSAFLRLTTFEFWIRFHWKRILMAKWQYDSIVSDNGLAPNRSRWRNWNVYNMSHILLQFWFPWLYICDLWQGIYWDSGSLIDVLDRNVWTFFNLSPVHEIANEYTKQKNVVLYNIYKNLCYYMFFIS